MEVYSAAALWNYTVVLLQFYDIFCGMWTSSQVTSQFLFWFSFRIVNITSGDITLLVLIPFSDSEFNLRLNHSFSFDSLLWLWISPQVTSPFQFAFSIRTVKIASFGLRILSHVTLQLKIWFTVFIAIDGQYASQFPCDNSSLLWN